MSKKKKKKHKKNNDSLAIFDVKPSKKSKKKLNKEFSDIIEEIERSQIILYEADRKARKKERKKINKKKAEFYTDMESIKCRAKLAKRWEKKGFLDSLLEILSKAFPVVKSIATTVCTLILAFLSVDKIKSMIQPKTLNKICKVFNVASAL